MTGGGPCLFHQRKLKEPDQYYEQKIVAGLAQPAATYLSPAQLNAVTKGRYRGDGRKLDGHVLPEPLLIDLPD